MLVRQWVSGVVVLLVAANGLRAQESARAVIERAIKAHGGLERLTRIRADIVETKGVVFVEGKETPFTGRTLVQMPSHFKNVLRISTPKGRVTMVQILNGDSAYVTIDGQPQKIVPSAMAEMRETFLLNRAMLLVPLLKDRSYELTLMGEHKVLGHRAQGVRVTSRGHREVRLFFDKETGLLVKSEINFDAGEGKEVRQEVFYSDFRDLGGYKRAVKLVAHRDGKKVMEAELTDVKYLDKINPAEFAKP